MSTEPNQVKWVGIRLAAGETALPVSMTMDYIRDTDNDTKVQTEKSADEDKVRIDTAGVERVVIDFNGVDLKSHRLIGLAAPTTAGDGIRQTTKITEASLEDAVDKKHIQSHAITSTSDHTSTATSGKMLKANANGLPVDATNTDTEVADAVTKKHTQNTDKIIKDTDADTSIDTEESADVDTIVVKAAGATVLKILANGNVGIGTTDPQGLLHVASIGAVKTWVTTTAITSSPHTEWNNGMGYTLVGTERSTTGGLFVGSAPYASLIGSVVAYPLQLATDNTVRMTIDSAGNVGIGTATLTSKLHVVGLPIYANNAAAVAGGLTAGAFYRTNGDPDLVCVVH